MKRENPEYYSGLIVATLNQLPFLLLPGRLIVILIRPAPVSHSDNPFRMSRKKENPAREQGRAYYIHTVQDN